ncbi:hypothetical protein CXB51_008303 [Gossypium anomalum]|uniref:ABC transporter domain-containing protein n=1 Tax=Gossypium anomalum TaxID=47600 RepID=A0A8J5YZX1_9ROSI|nr:hypothetical protein CXB51_008303 [Gossypium anomalum]
MAQLVGSDEIESLRFELAQIGRSIRLSFRSRTSSFCDGDHSEYELQWAEVQRLPTGNYVKGKWVVNVTKLGADERHMFIEKLIKQIEHDNLHLLKKLRHRIDKVGVKLSTVEVRYKNLHVEAQCELVCGKPLPILWNTTKSLLSGLANLPGSKQEAKISILNGVSGIIKPGRMWQKHVIAGAFWEAESFPKAKVHFKNVLELGSTIPEFTWYTDVYLKILQRSAQWEFDHQANHVLLITFVFFPLFPPLNVAGEITYNGYRLEEFVPQKTSAYISQYDLHTPEMTVREILDFSARFQGIGSRTEIMKEVSRREKQPGIVPDPDIDAYMKAISVKGQESTLRTDYILKILGLDICADTKVGDAIRRGISGGQKKRLTTGEMIVGPAKALFMDEISNGLDSSTTFQIVSCLQHLVYITDANALISLLQPAPETFDLFDDVILLAEGKIVYQGPRTNICKFFEDCGFKKDQEQYWYHKQQPYSYVSVDHFIKKFIEHHIGQNLDEELSKPFDKSQSHKDALSFKPYFLSKWELFKACSMRELLLMKRNSFTYVFKSVQLVIIASITMTTFLRTRMAVDVIHSSYFMGSLFCALVILHVDGFPKLSMTVSRIAVFYKQRELCFYPAWAYAIPAAILKVPLSLLESFFRQFLIYFGVRLTSISMFRCIASLFQTIVASTTVGALAIMIVLPFGGFILPRPSLPSWLEWGFWLSPLTYGEIGLSLNEFLAPRWEKVMSGNTSIGQQTLESRGLSFEGYFYWISVAALFAPGKSRTMISFERYSQLQRKDDKEGLHKESEHAVNDPGNVAGPKTGQMVLPFEPLTVTFQDVQYYVNIPQNIPGVPKIKDNYNPATWMLEVTSTSVEVGNGIDFAQIYKGSTLCKENKELVKQLSSPTPGSKDLYFPTRFPQNGLEQFKACLWKQCLSYWRSPAYNLTRIVFMTASSLMFGVLFWQQGKNINNQQDLFRIAGSMYAVIIFFGINNCSTVLPFVSTERTVLYRERFAGMYSSWAYSFAQLFWALYSMFCTLLYFNYLGMLLVSLTPNNQVASIVVSSAYTMLNLFAGFIIPKSQIPKWWIWLYYICPTSWAMNGMLTSQYGDVDKQILAFGETKTVAAFIEDYFGFHHSSLGIVAIFLFIFPVICATLFAYFIGTLNFQRR